ncbi:MAG: bifunctional diaminohydroxyphosphoribosylaminopyrimidine deaminase/5-amino-6-(5-phosphoribosylamino)uracil reductase RibD [Gammaproteobacteria bacterium]|nr:bifunctional diaminohydroxyphosphoribosylaminopyrimidine deaminase/5-amino-6-(5-phosphoribosylamino)uracil reductase RibD [Gammaproteobacteria bacterium]
MSVDDVRYMARALELARRGLYTTHPNPRVGCVIVRDGKVIGEGFHARAGEPHAEIHALRMAGAQARGATVYVTLEPCCHYGRTGPCSHALIEAGVARVVMAMRDPNPKVAGGGEAMLRAAGIEVLSGMLEDEARALNQGFIQRMTQGRPFVRLKWGASLDGRTALAHGASQWITGPEARRDVQFQRARSSAVLSSAETVIRDQARLNVRLSADELGMEGAVRQPVRVILDRTLRLTLDQPLFKEEGEVWIYSASEDRDRCQAVARGGVRLLSAPLTGAEADAALNLAWILEDLARREINEVWVEAGARLGGALLAAGLVDELILYLAPTLLGHSAQPLAVLPELARLDQARRWHWQDVRRVGGDLRLILHPSV